MVFPRRSKRRGDCSALRFGASAMDYPSEPARRWACGNCNTDNNQPLRRPREIEIARIAKSWLFEYAQVVDFYAIMDIPLEGRERRVIKQLLRPHHRKGPACPTKAAFWPRQNCGSADLNADWTPLNKNCHARCWWEPCATIKPVLPMSPHCAGRAN